jgi:CubicO group peptidase (beta-lactamase class C family)
MRISIGLVAVMAFPALCGWARDATVPRFTDPARRAKLEAAFPRIEKVFERFQQEHRIPGAVFGIVVDGELAYVKGFGVRDRTSQDPVTPDTVFRIASMTKSFTALSILKLRDAGKLSLEDPVAKWIPEFARFQYPTKDTAPILIRQLMSHGAGFPEDNPWGDRQLATDDATLTQWLEQGLPFSTPPDTSYEYSNYGFALLGRIVWKASGRPLCQLSGKQHSGAAGHAVHDTRSGDLAGECSRDGLPATR